MDADNILKDGTRVFARAYGKFGTILNSGTHKGKIAYAVLLDGWPDCLVLYAEEFDVTMTNFKKIKHMNIDELASWLDKHGRFDNSPWMRWFNETYCNNCPSEFTYVNDCTGMYNYKVECECSWCELHDKCKFFPDMDESPDNKDIIKMWLQLEVE